MYSVFWLFWLSCHYLPWLSRKTPLRKPNHGKGIVSRKPRRKSAHDFLGLLYYFIVLLCIYVVSCPYMIYYPTVMARCSLFVLKVPLNRKQTLECFCEFSLESRESHLTVFAYFYVSSRVIALGCSGLVVSTSGSDWLQRLLSKITYNALMTRLNPTDRSVPWCDVLSVSHTTCWSVSANTFGNQIGDGLVACWHRNADLKGSDNPFPSVSCSGCRVCTDFRKSCNLKVTFSRLWKV